MLSLQSLQTFTCLDRETTRKGIALAVAAWLSFLVAALLSVHHAFWAAMPVWVIAQSSRGLVMERAIFRVIGTLIGAALGFALVHLPLPPAVQLVMLASWIGMTAGLTHILRGVTGYGALLAGITAAIVVIPSVLAPEMSFDIAVSRVECTLIGVIVSTIVLAVLTPSASFDTFYGNLRIAAADAVALAARILRDPEIADSNEARHVFATLSTLESSARLTAAGSPAAYRRLEHVDGLVVGSLSVMAAAQAARAAGPVDDALADWLDRIARQLRAPADGAMPVPERCPGRAGSPALARLDTAMAHVLNADSALRDGSAQSPDIRRLSLAPHREWQLAAMTGALAGLTSLAGALLALWLKWPPMGLMALGLCIFVMVLGSLSNPQWIAPKLFVGVVLGVVVALFYRLVVQPGITSTMELLFTLAPFLLLGGLVRVSPRVGPAGLDANMCFMLASQAGMPATGDLGQIFGESLALVLAAGLMAGSFYLMPHPAARQARDAAGAIRRDLRRVVANNCDGVPAMAQDWHARGMRHILRVVLHLGRAHPLQERWPRGGLAALNFGQAVIDLQQIGMPTDMQRLLTDLLDQRASPETTAAALTARAGTCPDASTRQLMLWLADTVRLSADLLAFGQTQHAA